MNDEVQRLEILWTPEQVARYFGINRNTVYRWIREGRYLDPDKLVKIGTSVRIPRSEIERIVFAKKKELKQ